MPRKHSHKVTVNFEVTYESSISDDFKDLYPEEFDAPLARARYDALAVATGELSFDEFFEFVDKIEVKNISVEELTP